MTPISADLRKHKSYLKSLSGLISPESSEDDSWSVNSEDVEWRLGDYINTGSIGAVYRALDWNTAKLITIKFLDVKGLDQSQKDEITEKIQGEVNKIKIIKDPNIVKYINVTIADDEDDMVAILMEYVPGGSITYLLKFFKSFKEPLVKIYIGQVAKVLSRLHNKGIVHRDLKPDNLMVDDLGTVKLSDFGFIKSIYSEFCPDNSQDLDIKIIDKQKSNFVKSIPDKSTLEKLVIGDYDSEEPLKPLINSYFYCPPEVINKECKRLDPSYDIWSLGWIWYEMLTGNILMYDTHDPSSIKLPDNITEEWADFMKRWLEYDPDQRATIDELWNHKFLRVKDNVYKDSHEAINFMSLYSLVASSQAPPNPQKMNDSSHRLSFMQKHSKYQARDSVLSNYKITPELSRALGIDTMQNKKVSLCNVTIDIESLKRYSRNSLMINSLTNINYDAVKSPRGSMGEDDKLGSSKLESVLKKIQNKT